MTTGRINQIAIVDIANTTERCSTCERADTLTTGPGEERLLKDGSPTDPALATVKHTNAGAKQGSARPALAQFRLPVADPRLIERAGTHETK